MHYGHLIKYRYYVDGIFIIYRARKERDADFQMYKHFRREY
jgi:hypothetical protein